MKTIKTILTIFVLMLLLSCGPKVRTVNPDATNLNNYETFAYLPNTNVEVEGSRYSDENINQTIVEAVRSNLMEEGFELDRDDPDLLVLISTATDMEAAVSTDPIYATYPYSPEATTVSPFYEPYYYNEYDTFDNIVGYDLDTYAYEEGTLVINLIDRQTKNVVWKGVATQNIYDQPSPEAIQNMVDDIFEEFPEN